MRLLACILLFAGMLSAAGCQTQDTGNAIVPATSQPAGPLDNVTNAPPPGLGQHNTMR